MSKSAAIKVINVIVTDGILSVDLEDGRTISAPIGWYPRLAYGTPEERTHWEISGAGYGIHWRDLDEDMGVEGLLLGKKSKERPESLKRWLSHRRKTPTQVTVNDINQSLKMAPPDNAEREGLKKMSRLTKRMVKGTW